MAVNVEAFYDMINGIARQQVNATPMDLTIDVEINKLANVDIGEYKVQYQGNVFSAFSVDPTVTYNVGERVYVLVPQGDFSTKKVILGYSKYDSNLSDSQRQDLQNQYIVEGPNWYEVDGENYLPDHHPLQICAVPLMNKDRLVTDDGQGGGAFYEDVGFQRALVDQKLIDVLQATKEAQLKKAEDKYADVDSYLETCYANLAANGLTESQLDAVINGNILHNDALYEQLLRELDIAEEEPTTRPAAVLMAKDKADDVNERFGYYAEVYDYIMISAKFRTEFHMPMDRGNYYLRVSFWADNPDYVTPDDPDADNKRGQPRNTLMEFDLGFRQFNGAPYSFVVDTPQQAFYQVTPGKLKGLYRVSLMQDGNFVSDIYPSYVDGALQFLPQDRNFERNNIFCDDIEIRFAKKIDMLETPYYCYIETPLGDKVYDATAAVPKGRNYVELIPHFMHQQQEITQDCVIQWYREDLSVTPSTPTEKDKFGKVWTDYTGAGWRPIEQLTDSTMRDWEVEKDGTLTVYKEAVPWQWRFKVVCIYNDGEVFGTAIQTVTNRDSKYSLYLEQYTNETSQNVMLRINEKEPHRVGIDPLSEPEAITSPGTYPEWFGTWYVQLPDESYILANNDAQFWKGPLNVTPWLTYDVVTFRVACYDPRKILPPDGVGELTIQGIQSEPIGYLEKTFINTDGELLVDWIGQKSFGYTALGKAYPNISKNEYTLQPKLNWAMDPMNYRITIIAPDGAPLGSRNYYNSNVELGENQNNATGNGYDPEGSMMYNMYVDADDVVHFKVRPELEPTRDRNVLIARVLTIADGTWYEAPCEVKFTKDGQSGTQGSGWTAILDLVNSEKGGRKVYHPVRQAYIDVAQPAWTMPIALPAYPLIVKQKMVNNKPTWVQDENNHVYLRPFVTKEGQDVMDFMGEGKNYKVVVSWDVRYSKNATFGPARRSSFLRLHDPANNGAVLDMLNENGGYQFGDKETNPSQPTGTIYDGVATHGLYGQTSWDGAQDRTSGRNKFFGAVEVKFYDAQQDLAIMDGMTDEEKNYTGVIDLMMTQGWYFVVKATIDIYSNNEEDFPRTSGLGKYDDIMQKQLAEQGTLSSTNFDPNKAYTPSMQRVKTIVAYQPIDIFFVDDVAVNAPQFDPILVKSMNWPLDIEYDSRGCNPTVVEGFLDFQYDARPDTDTKLPTVFVVPQSMVKRLATVEVVRDEKDAKTYEVYNADGELVEVDGEIINEYDSATLSKSGVSRYRYKPNTKLNWEEGLVGTLMGVLAPTIDNPNVPTGRYYRNQIFQVNNYENIDINAWDGISIDINEDNGSIFAPTMGAGWKNPFTNSFTGVLMGVNSGFPKEVRDADGNAEEGQGINQLAIAGMSKDEIAMYPYMTGIFGYQDGWSSFGLLENGTAFFGRADRGGRIIIDGYNATIYGGANGVFTSPKIGDAMWNAMRLTMVDLSHATSGDVADYYDANGVAKPLSDEESTYKDEGKPTNDAEDGSSVGQGDIPPGANPTTTAVQGITQGFGGGYFGSTENNDDPYQVKNRLPSWYKMVWQGAYLIPLDKTSNQRGLPYWFKSNEEGSGTSDRPGHAEVWVREGADGSLIAYSDDEVDGKHYLKKRFIPNPAWVPQLEDLSEAQISNGAISGAYGMEWKAQQNFDYGYGNFGVNYWNPSIKAIRSYAGYGQTQDEDGKQGKPVTGFGPSRASTTPAIEIGQHPTGLMPGLIPMDYPLKNIFSDIFIPGDRNFMVTYDGTMWAMNGVFLGNVIGSNIIGGRINGAEIGIGDVLERSDWENMLVPLGFGNWGELISAKLVAANKVPMLEDIFSRFQKAAHILDDGTALFRTVFIFGGEIHLGTFHILGQRQWGVKEGLAYYDEQEGHLMQFGISDFMGPTRVYGSLAIGPNLTDFDNSTDANKTWYGKRQGNLFQTAGLASLGIILPIDEAGDPDFTYHQIFSALEYKTAYQGNDGQQHVWHIDGAIDGNRFLQGGKKYTINYDAVSFDYGDPKIQTSEGLTVEQMAMFSVYSGSPLKLEEKQETPPSSEDDNRQTMDKTKALELVDKVRTERNAIFRFDGNEQQHFDAMISAVVQLKSMGAYNDEMGSGYDLYYKIEMSDKALNEFLSICTNNIAEAIDSNGKPAGGGEVSDEDIGYKGHFWPMSFRYYPVVSGENEEDNPTLQAVHSYMTTMDQFQSKGFKIDFGSSNPENSKQGVPVGGSNYFRVGPWGQEGCRYYVCNGWQSESKSAQPSPKRYADLKDGKIDTMYPTSPRGVMGLVDRNGTGEPDETMAPAIGIETWGNSPLIFYSDDNLAMRIIGFTYNSFVDMSKTRRDLKDNYAYEGPIRMCRYAELQDDDRWVMASITLGKDKPEAYAMLQERGLNESPEWKGEVQELVYKSSVISIGQGWGTTGCSWKQGYATQEENFGGFAVDAQGSMGIIPPKATSGGYGGTYLWGKDDVGVHIIQTKDKTISSSKDGKYSELFLFHEQASLVGEKVILIGTHPDNFTGLADGGLKSAGVKNNIQGAEGGISHMPNSTEGSAMIMADGYTQFTVKNFFGVDIGTDAVKDSGMGHTALKSAAGFGINDKNIEMYHERFVSIHKGKLTESYKDGQPALGIGIDRGYSEQSQAIFIGDGAGAMEGIDGKLYMRDQWAIPDNQFCIYARFG